MTGATDRESRDSLATQAREMRRQYPELSDMLLDREKELALLLAAVPSPADVERAAVFDGTGYLFRLRRRLRPGLTQLLEERQNRPPAYRARLRLVQSEED